MKTILRVAALLISGAIAAPATAQDFDAGMEAWKAGDDETALENWLPLAEQGDAYAQYYLGYIYLKGRGVERDYSESLRWFRLAAEQDNASALGTLGYLYYYGEGVTQDYHEAAQWFHAAVEIESSTIEYHLGLMYENGYGVLQDYTEAVRLYRSAAWWDDVDAQNALGLMYGRGYGVEQDLIMAHMWFNIAAANGHEDAADTRASVASEMTREQIADAQARARVCMASEYDDCD